MEPPELENNNANNNILVLRSGTRTMISSLLNPLKLLQNEKGVPRDWHGLAELCAIPGELLPSISRDPDPTAKILKLWNDQAKADATVDKLINYLEQLDRSDVVDDILPLIAEDLKFHKEHTPNGKAIQLFDTEADDDILTGDDLERKNNGLHTPQFYDAFVLFAEEDLEFATELITNMEKNYDFKLCVKDRDVIAGRREYDTVIRLIAERCGRLIVILSPAFLQSNVNKFFYSIAQSISIEQRARKIIPCIYTECGKLPPELDCYCKLDKRRSGTFYNFWDKLRDSIKMPEKSRAKLSLPENSLFRGVETPSELMGLGNPVSRSVSNSEQYLSPSSLKPTLHKDTSASRNISQTVKFSNSMSNLPDTEVPEDNIVPSTSANSVARYELRNPWRSFSFLRQFKSFSLASKSKADKQRLSEQQSEKLEDKNNKEESVEGVEERNDNQNNEEDVKHQKKEKKKEKQKKKKFSLNWKKKKAVLADT